MEKEKTLEKEIIEKMIKFVVVLFKWVCLLATVIFGGLTVALLIMVVVKNVDLTNSVTAKMVSYITLFSESRALSLVQKYGPAQVAYSGLLCGLASTFTYGIFYYLLDKYLVIFNNITNGKIFVRENMNIIKKCNSLALLGAVIGPLILTLEFFTTGLVGPERADYSGLFYAILAYTFYILFKRGFELENKNNKLNKEVDKFKEEEENKKIEEIKKDVKKKKTSKK